MKCGALAVLQPGNGQRTVHVLGGDVEVDGADPQRRHRNHEHDHCRNPADHHVASS